MRSQSQSHVFGGPTAQAMPGIQSVRGHKVSAAVYTTRGPNRAQHGVEYKAHNEDAVMLRYRPADRARNLPEIMAIGAFDQAGGVYGAPRQGIASQIAAKYFDKAVAYVEQGHDPQTCLNWAVTQADLEIHKLGLASTFGGVITLSRPWLNADEVEVWVATCGDTRVAAYDATGELRWSTRLHNFVAEQMAQDPTQVRSDFEPNFRNMLTRSLGSGNPRPDVSLHGLKRGDRLAVYTDGPGDAFQNLDLGPGRHHGDAFLPTLGRILAGRSPKAGIQAVFAYVLEQMRRGICPPDNMGVGVLEVL